MEHNAQNQNFKLPQIENIEIKLIPHEAPKLRYFKSSFSKYSQAIEFLITTDAPIPVRALSPVLYIGEMPLTEGETIKENSYRFLAFEINELKDNTPIYFGWQGDRKEQPRKTKFVYKRPGIDIK
jgi:hypothetical protein